MANENLLDKTAAASLALTDVIYAVVDPSGTPLDRQAPLSVVDTLLRSGDLAFAQTASVAVADTASETTLVGAGLGSATLPAAALNSAGKSLRVRMWGYLSNTGTPTLNLKVKLGSVVIAATGDVTMPADQSNVQVELEVELTVRTTGATGTVFAAGKVWIDDVRYPMLNTAVSSAVDLTGTLAVGLTADWSAADPGNTITAALLKVTKEN